MDNFAEHHKRFLNDKFEEFELKGCIAVPKEMSLAAFFDEFTELIESKNWTYGGGLNGYVEEKE